jgi:hypothetical protein
MGGKGKDGVERELSREVHASVERVDLLASFLSALARPVPEYEPEFRHVPSPLLAH